MKVKRNRAIYIILTVTVILSGLASRKYQEFLPSFLAEYSGDTLWALMIFLISGFFFSYNSTLLNAAVALLFCFAVEFSQLYQAEWINMIRQTKIGGLILGYGFLWSDLLCYAAGISAGAIIEILFPNIFFKISRRD